jgi:acyl-CoA reductase-like NAD-dependent aldehyde dehydrogenase
LFSTSFPTSGDLQQELSHTDYPWFWDERNRTRGLTRTTSGGVAINSTILHYVQDDLPFGGVGPSGFGAYHGIEGSRAFSHQKAVFNQGAGMAAHCCGHRSAG